MIKEKPGVSQPRTIHPAAYSNEPEPGATQGLKCRILISIPTVFQLRQFVHSGVLDLLLKRGAELLIISPNRAQEGFTAELPKERVYVRSLEIEVGPLRQRYIAARKHLLLTGPLPETLRQSMADLRRGYPYVALAAKGGNRLLRRAPRLKQWFLSREYAIFQEKALDTLLTAEPVDLLLLGTPGYMTQDIFLLHAAVQHGIPVVAAVLSWDNLSSKCLINPKPDRLLVWSEHMRHEAIDLQAMSADRIVVTGPPHYDIFANGHRFGSRSENLRHLGLDPERRLILYGTNHAAHFPDEIEVVKHVAQWVEGDMLGMPCHLWVRLHPQAVTGPYKVPTDPYRSLASARVKVEFPPIRDSKLPWDLPKSDHEHLVRLLRDADVVINTASTLAIDAAIFDRPVICIGYDPAGDLPYDNSVRRYYDQTHNAHVVRAKAAQLATSPDDLRQKLTAYLERPTLDREGRQRIVEQQFGRIDGRSAARLVDQVVAMALARTAKGGACHG
jgi:hypothetical protein